MSLKHQNQILNVDSECWSLCSSRPDQTFTAGTGAGLPQFVGTNRVSSQTQVVPVYVCSLKMTEEQPVTAAQLRLFTADRQDGSLWICNCSLRRL